MQVPITASETLSSLPSIQGLRSDEIPALQQKFGKNMLQANKAGRILTFAKETVTEPMFLLLVLSAITYFVLGSDSEGIMMIAALLLVSAIAFFQELRSSSAITALNELSEPAISVVRDGKISQIVSAELVPGDIILLEEGMKIPADAEVLESNDLTSIESAITGESYQVEKRPGKEDSLLYQGATINSGKCTARVIATGKNTRLGKIGQSLEETASPKSQLQIQINQFVKRMAYFGFAGLITIFVINIIATRDLPHSILTALTIALSAIPEEIPVAFSSFMALGALKLSRLGIIVRQPQTVENLGRVDVVCLDKTGTLTENKMNLSNVENFDSKAPISRLYLMSVLASERDPFDAMEKAIWQKFQEAGSETDLSNFKLFYEYSLEGRPPMMTHIYANDEKLIAAGKGAVERIIEVCKLNEVQKQKVLTRNSEYGSNGFRVLGVCSAELQDKKILDSQDEYNWQFEGLLAFNDPLKPNVPGVFEELFHAGIDVKIITGDYPETAMFIAGSAGLPRSAGFLTGKEIVLMEDNVLEKKVGDVHVFARIFPDAKLRVVRALKSNGKIVAMTGDGVNDAPALKGADVGIAMGKKGTGIARQAADLVLTDDNLDRLVISVREGRKIFSNFRKAIRYIISIHIPIILTAALPLLLGWKFGNIFSPIHVIFLELIMGPTCSIFFEREPAEKNIMNRSPVGLRKQLFESGELRLSIVQGLVITAGLLFLYYYFMRDGATISQVRSIVFTALIFCNLLLTFANRSFTYTIFESSRIRNGLEPFIVVSTLLLLSLIHFVTFFTNIFQVSPVEMSALGIAIGVSVVSVVWIDLYKLIKRPRRIATTGLFI
jgi:Ca2+-transporting ATPase